MKIHPTALIDPQAHLGSGVEVGPYSIIGPYAKIGNDTKISSHVVIEGHTQIGARCTIFPGACLGTAAQDKKFKDGIAYVSIGDDNVIREYVTINAGSSDGAKTVLGNKNFIMINCHVGHDCQLGDEITMANGSTLGGHAVIEDKAVLGGYAGVHQFVRIGKLAILGAFAKASMDVPPFSLCDGYPARVYGLNSIGLKRAGYTSEMSQTLKKAFKLLFMSGLNTTNAVSELQDKFSNNVDIQHLIKFIKNSKRGVLRVSVESKD